MADPVGQMAEQTPGVDARGALDGVDPAGTSSRRGQGLTAKAVAGFRWSSSAALLSAAIQLGYVATMSRLLSPTAFGIMAMAQIVVNFGQYLTRMGAANTLIQKPAISDEDLRVSATTGALLGLACMGVVYTLAPRFGQIYTEPDVVPVLRGLSLTFIPAGLGITSIGLLRRQLRFREIAIMDVTTALTSAVVGVVLAIGGAGVWSLVAAAITTHVLMLALQYSRARHPVRPSLRWRVVKPLYGSATRFSTLRILEFLSKNLDTFAVGRYLSSAVTGVYSRAFTLVNMPLSRYLSSALSKVLFPSFSAVEGDLTRLRRGYGSVLLFSAITLLPIATGMAVAAPELVRVVLGSQFDDAIVLVPFFAFAAVLAILSHLSQLVCEAVAELNRTIMVQLLSLAVLVVLLSQAAGHGTWAFAVALVTAEVLRHVAILGLLHRTIALDMSDLYAAYVPAILASVAVAAAVAGTRAALVGTGMPVVLMLACEIVAAATALLLSVRWLPFPAMRDQLRAKLNAVPHSGRPGRFIDGLSRMVLDAPPARSA